MSFWTLAPWLNRFIILTAAALFTLISLKFVLDPRQAAASAGITPETAVGFTNLRAGFGGFPLGFAAILVFCLLSTRRHLAALAAIATIVAVILAVRIYGAAQDGTYAESAHLLIPETVMVLVSLLGVLMETRRRSLAGAAG
jgi:hypothetical protein